MKVLVFLGSPRKGGNTEILVREVMAGIEEAGSKTELIRLAQMKIHPCIGCGGCEKEGKCVIQDEMQLLYPKIVDADRIIVASPIYFYGVTAQTKAFLDRCQALWSRKYLLNQRLQGKVPKIGYYVGVSATSGKQVFQGAILTVKYALDAMDFVYGGELVVRGADKKGVMAEKANELKKAKKFGKSVVQA